MPQRLNILFLSKLLFLDKILFCKRSSGFNDLLKDAISNSNQSALPVKEEAVSPQEVITETVSRSLLDSRGNLTTTHVATALSSFLGARGTTFVPHIKGILTVFCDYDWPNEVDPYRILTTKEIV